MLVRNAAKSKLGPSRTGARGINLLNSLTLHLADAAHWANPSRNEGPRKACGDALKCTEQGEKDDEQIWGGQRRPSTLSCIESLLFAHVLSILYMSAEHLSYFIILCCLVIIFFSQRSVCISPRNRWESYIWFWSLQACHQGKEGRTQPTKSWLPISKEKNREEMGLLFFQDQKMVCLVGKPPKRQ